MPEYRVRVRWPDGETDQIYSPSSVVQDFFCKGESLSLTAFQIRGREALLAASRRVEAKYGSPCGRAMAELHRLEHKARQLETKTTPLPADGERLSTPVVDILSVGPWGIVDG